MTLGGDFTQQIFGGSAAMQTPERLSREHLSKERSSLLHDQAARSSGKSLAKQRPAMQETSEKLPREKFSQHLRQEQPLEDQASSSFAPKEKLKDTPQDTSNSQPVPQDTVPQKSAGQDAPKVAAKITDSGQLASGQAESDAVTVNTPNVTGAVQQQAVVNDKQAVQNVAVQNAAVQNTQIQSGDVVVSADNAATEATDQPVQPTLGVILLQSSPEADASPIILVKTQVVKLSGHIQSLTVGSGTAEGAMSEDAAQKLAIEIYGLIDALAKIAQSFNLAENGAAHDRMIALPVEAQRPLEILSELQNLLDADSFAALLGNVPSLALPNAEQLTAAQQQLSNATIASPKAEKSTVQANTSQANVVTPNFAQNSSVARNTVIGDHVFVVLVASENTQSVPQPVPMQLQNVTQVSNVQKTVAQNTGDLPEWLSDAAKTPVARPYTPKQAVPLSAQNVAVTAAVVEATSTASIQPAPVQPENVSGSALRQKLDQKAANYMQAQRHNLPINLQNLTQVPVSDSADYSQWVDRVAQVVHQAGFTQAMGAEGHVASSTYVFEEPEVTRLLQMLSVTALRDVISSAGKLSRRIAAQSSMLRSQDVLGETQTQSQQLQGSLSRTTGVSAQQLSQTEASVKPVASAATAVRDQASAAISLASLATASPTTNNRAAERDVRVAGRKNSGNVQATATQKHNGQFREPQLDQQETMLDSRRSFEMQRQAEGEILRQSVSAEPLESNNVSSKSSSQSSAQAALAQRQAQIALIAKHIRTQITMQVLRQAQSNAETVELQLNPRRLGKMEVRISREIGGKMAINFAIENPETLEALRNNVDDLLQSLREAGVNTDGGAMNFTLKEENRQAFEQKQKKNSAADMAEEEEEILELGQEAEIDASGHVNVRV